MHTWHAFENIVKIAAAPTEGSWVKAAPLEAC